MVKKKEIIIFSIVAIICISIFSIALAQKQLQNDTFYTIKIGEHIASTKTIDMKDPFSWHENLTYTYPHWLYDLGIYLIYNMGFNINGIDGGMLAIYISTCLLTTILGLLIYFTNVKVNKNRVISFFLTMITIYLMRTFLAARAQLATYILFVLEIYFIERFLERKKLRYGIILFAIATLIANLHAAVWYMFFIITLPYFVEYIIVVILERFNKFKGKITKIEFVKRDNVKWLLLIIVICMLAGLLTPQNTYEPYTHIIKLMQGNTTKNISEHKPIVLIESKETLIYIVIIIGFLIFTKAKITLKDLFMLGGLMLMTLISRRQRSMLFIIGIYSVINILNMYLNTKKENFNIEATKIISKYYSVISILMITLSFGFNFYGNKNKIDYINQNKYPVRAAQYILQELDVENIRLFNGYNYGSYLLFKNIPVFIDSRCDLYTPEFNDKDIFMDTHNITNLLTNYDAKFNEYKITHIITEINSRLDMVLSMDEKYRNIYIDSKFCIYEKIK